LENLDAEMEINSASETVREDMKNFSQRESRLLQIEEHKQWFDKGCSELSNQRK
jgi:hypothetical protein